MDPAFVADPTVLSAPAAERRAAGRARRQRAPRSSHRAIGAAHTRRDPIALIAEQNASRLPDLIPVRWGRMAQSPFAFLRGAAVVMAEDLASTPTSGLTVQCCGDAHLLNFGAFASHERRDVFDLNDFDETLAGPWEWDLKRLTASAVVAAHDRGFDDDVARHAARAAIDGYRSAMAAAAKMSTLDIWYQQVELGISLADRLTARQHKAVARAQRSMQRRTGLSLLPKLTTITNGSRRIVERPPLIVHADLDGEADAVRAAFDAYCDSLGEDRKLLLQRFRLVDIARKVVGVGSVGTRCHILLLVNGDDEALFLQSKEAGASVLERHCGAYDGHAGKRVVHGQRMIQMSGDSFLGWTTFASIPLYVRQLRDRKLSFDIASFTTEGLPKYLEVCGVALARAHARTGDPVAIDGYLGRGVGFTDAVVDWSIAYAAQTVADHARLLEAIAGGEVEALDGV